MMLELPAVMFPLSLALENLDYRTIPYKVAHFFSEKRELQNSRFRSVNFQVPIQ